MKPGTKRSTRAGAGRPRSVGGTSSVEVGFFISAELAGDLATSAAELGVTKSELMRRLIARGLTEKQHGVIIRPTGGRHAKS